MRCFFIEHWETTSLTGLGNLAANDKIFNTWSCKDMFEELYFKFHELFKILDLFWDTYTDVSLVSSVSHS